MGNNIFIFSQSIRTGKTTVVMDWARRHRDVAGILTPDKNGRRHLYKVATQEWLPLQRSDGEVGISIGRFILDEQVMQQVRHVLSQAVESAAQWVIVDEVGRLEIDRGEGLEPTLSGVLDQFKHRSTEQKLLLIIRDYLLDYAIEHYGLQDANILHPSFFTEALKPPPLIGMVLCGGASTRMGSDKSLIPYHGKPQYERVLELVHPFCETSLISGQQKMESLTKPYNFVKDEACYAGQGPLTGVLSVRDRYPEKGLWVVGCDYPFLQRRDLLQLYQERKQQYDAICFIHPETNIAEPLMTIYEATALKGLREFLKEGGQSLRYFLKTLRTRYLVPHDLLAIRSIDTPKEMLLFQEQYAGRKE